jgi:hypothetical protein
MPQNSSQPNRRAPSARSGGSGRPARSGGAGQGKGSAGGRPSSRSSSGGGAARRGQSGSTGGGDRRPARSGGTRGAAGRSGTDRPSAGGSGRTGTSSARSAGAAPSRGSGKSAGQTGRPRAAGARTDGPRSGPARTGAPRTGASRSGAPRSAAPRSASSRSGATGSGPPRRTGTSRDAGARARPGTDRPARQTDERPPLPRKAAGWGNVARRGAHQVSQRDGEERSRDDSDERERERRRSAPKRKPVEKWTRDDGAREWADVDAPPAKGRGRRAGAAPAADDVVEFDAVKAIAGLSAKHALPLEIATDIRNAADVATARHREHLVDRAESAYGAYERGRFQDALRAIKPVVDEAPGVAAVRELAGLAAYRCGRWRSAAGHLEAFGRLSDSAEHLPILMDCQRALHKPKKVAALWAELRQSSPDPDVLAEGRIVAAASLADSGDLNGAIAMLSTAGASKALRNPSERHVRQWYLLADLYERAGDVPKAREYFERVFRADPEAYDVAERLRGLGPERRPQRRRPKASTSTKTGPPTAKG